MEEDENESDDENMEKAEKEESENESGDEKEQDHESGSDEDQSINNRKRGLSSDEENIEEQEVSTPSKKSKQLDSS